MSLLIRYAPIFAFPLLPLHCWSTTTHPCTDATALASLDQSHLFDGHMFYDSHVLFLFLVSPMCTLLWSDQSWTLTMWSGTFYNFASDEPYALFLVDHLYLTCMYLPFETEKHPYEFPPEFKLRTYTLHCITFTSHPQSPIGFILRSPAL